MSLTSLRPILRSQDLVASVNLHGENLGFTPERANQEWDGPPCHVTAALMLAPRNERAAYDKIGEDFLYGMREFAVYDKNGYLH
jgi:hypothetical protein